MTQSTRLRVLMARHDLTQPDVARICHVSVDTVKNWMGDSRKQDAPEGYVDLVEMTLASGTKTC